DRYARRLPARRRSRHPLRVGQARSGVGKGRTPGRDWPQHEDRQQPRDEHLSRGRGPAVHRGGARAEARTRADVAHGKTMASDPRRVFRELHQSGCFVMPNPWDVGSARLLAQIGFKAVATTSAGFAWSIGRPDTGVTLAEALAHLRAISESVD